MTQKAPENSLLPDQGVFQAAEDLVNSRRRAILHIEDTAAHAALVHRALDTSLWKIEHVTRAEAAIAAFEKDSDRILLLDLTLPDSDGLTLLGKLRAISSKAPIIVVTAIDKVPVSVEAMQKGAWDYVVKSDPQETVLKIVAAIERAWIGRQRRAENDLVEKTKIVELVRTQRLEAIEEIVRTVCHEVNNPLSGVMALSQLLINIDSGNEEIKELAEGIVKSAAQVAEAVQKLKSAEVSDFQPQDSLDS